MVDSKDELSRGELLMVLGGLFHDFAGFSQAMTPVLEAQGFRVSETYDLADLARLKDEETGTVLMYTCMGSRQPLTETDRAGLDALVRWVEAGGAFLAAHAATVSGKEHAGFAEMAGGYFIEHPPQFAFQVTPLGRAHPITAGVSAFGVFDEFYIQSYTADVEIHLVAADRGVAYPMAWSRRHGAGRVANVALGHSEQVWRLPAYQQLMTQAVDWISGHARAT